MFAAYPLTTKVSLVFVLSLGFKLGVFLFVAGRDGGRIDLLRRRERKTGKMEPDKDSKIEAKLIRNTQKRAITHNWTIPGRGPEFEPLGVQMEFGFSTILQVAP